jgi:hypothetical protein
MTRIYLNSDCCWQQGSVPCNMKMPSPAYRVRQSLGSDAKPTVAKRSLLASFKACTPLKANLVLCAGNHLLIPENLSSDDEPHNVRTRYG